jgi:putative nucleotidyltransferase with HDIG domain
LEETKIAVHIAEEIGLDVNIVRLGCLFHDIGKVLEGEGSHVRLGVEFLKRFNIPQKIVDCVAQHHEDTPFTSLEAVIVHIADQISGARPGARYEDYENYVKRLKEMEKIAKNHEGVEDAYAFEAGRELRALALRLKDSTEKEFTNALIIWHERWHTFLDEKSLASHKKRGWEYTHRRSSSAYRSLKENLGRLFTYQKYPELNLPNTTNTLDGMFSQIKNRLAVHRGLRRDRRYKLISEVLSGRKDSN